MKIFSEIGAFIAEDGAKFFSHVEAKTHEEIAYIGKSIATYGHADVTSAINEVEKLYPEARKMLTAVFDHLRYRQAGMVVAAGVEKLESYLAPENIAATPPGAGEPANDAPTPTTPPTEPPPPPSEPERVTKPDPTPRPSNPPDTGASAPSALDTRPADASPPLTRSDLGDAVPPYVAPVPVAPPAAPEVATPAGVTFPDGGGAAPVSDGSGGAGAPAVDPIATMKGIASIEAERAQNGG